MIRAILAHDDLGGIGRHNKLPWPHNSADLQWFKQNTVNQTVVMGANTWHSVGMPKPLPNRYNVVVSSRSPDLFPGADLVITPEMYNTSWKEHHQEHWIIGGAQMIEESLGWIDELYLTHIPGNYRCHVFIPLKKIETLFTETWREEQPECTFRILRRRK